MNIVLRIAYCVEADGIRNTLYFQRTIDDEN